MRLFSIALVLIGVSFVPSGQMLVGDQARSAPPQEEPAANFVRAPDVALIGPKAKDAVMSEIKQAPDGLFYVTVHINTKPVRFVIDSGASVVVLTKTDAQALSLASSSTKRQSIQTASGSKPMRWTRLDTLSIAGQTLTNVDAAIIDSGLQTSLLGQNALAQLGSVVQTGTTIQIRYP